MTFAPDDVLLFGSESKGCPRRFSNAYEGGRVRIPLRSGVRSINLANAVAIGLFTALSSSP